MFTTINHKGKIYKADLSLPIDISIPLRAGEKNVNAWHAAPVKIKPVRAGDWVGEVSLGGSVNFRNIAFNPHGNGTHTECVGHISKENYSINQGLKKFFFIADFENSYMFQSKMSNFHFSHIRFMRARVARSPSHLDVRSGARRILRAFRTSN